MSPRAALLLADPALRAVVRAAVAGQAPTHRCRDCRGPAPAGKRLCTSCRTVARRESKRRWWVQHGTSWRTARQVSAA